MLSAQIGNLFGDGLDSVNIVSKESLINVRVEQVFGTCVRVHNRTDGVFGSFQQFEAVPIKQKSCMSFPAFFLQFKLLLMLFFVVQFHITPILQFKYSASSNKRNDRGCDSQKYDVYAEDSCHDQTHCREGEQAHNNPCRSVQIHGHIVHNNRGPCRREQAHAVARAALSAT